MIHIYDKNGNFKDSLNYSKEEFLPAWYSGYQKGDYISELKFEHPIVNQGVIREMTREELLRNGFEVQLNAGEIIKNNKIVEVKKPDNKPYWNWNGTDWVFDGQKEKEDYFNLIDQLKAKRLAYGFDYLGHRQRCRDKDIAFMVATVLSLQVAKQVLNKDRSIRWFFEDNFGKDMDLIEISKLMLMGTTFIESIYNTENYFKLLDNIEMITEEEFENKRQEIHKKIMEGEKNE